MRIHPHWRKLEAENLDKVCIKMLFVLWKMYVKLHSYQTFELNGYSVDREGIRQFVSTSFRFLLLSKSRLNTKSLTRQNT